MLPSKLTNISLITKEAKKHLINRPNKWKKISDATYLEVDIGGNVVIPIPDVDRA